MSPDMDPDHNDPALEKLKAEREKTYRPAPFKTALYTIKDAGPGRGLGVFAAKAIPKGTRITCEKALLTGKREPNDIDPLAIYEPFAEVLTRAEQEVYLKLAASPVQTQYALNCMDEDLDQEIANLVAKVWSIFESNAFNMGEPDQDGTVTAGVFEVASRFNHSCRPNVAQTWNSKLDSLTIHSIRHIEKGEELCDSYVPLCQPSARRKEELKAYGFECRCEVCGGLGVGELEKSDENRAMIARLGEDLNFYGRRRRASLLGPISPSLVKGGKDDPLNVLEYIELLLKQEGLEGHDLCQYYSFAAYYCESRKPENLQESLEWQQKFYDLNMTLKAADHEDTSQSLKRLIQLKKKSATS